MRRFRKKPIEIRAIQFDGGNSTQVEAFMIGHDAREFFAVKNGGQIVLITTPEGTMEARPGDWIIRGIKGEFYPCKPDIFDATYEAVEE